MKVQALIILSAGLLLGSAGVIGAQTAADLNSEAARMNSLASNRGESNVVGKISGDFKSFLGADANAVVTGLRNGTPITLTRTTTTPSTAPGGLPVTTTDTTLITPPTGQMGHGNVYISLALAKQQLSQMGINEPTPQQLQAALTGGSITQTTATGTTTTKLQGILTMRSEKMGWGKIAQELDTKLGPVVSGVKKANQNLAGETQASGKASNVASGSQPTNGATNHTVSAGGKAHGNVGQGQSAARGSGSGIVTASGRSGGVATGSGQSGGSAGGGASQQGNASYGASQGKGNSK
jgi:hypothetical protein